ncbi:MAG: hypothetical protein SH807_06310 [Blastochloris sp.]|nr:hypothetical protein [Blastochloris sp.]
MAGTGGVDADGIGRAIARKGHIARHVHIGRRGGSVDVGRGVGREGLDAERDPVVHGGVVGGEIGSAAAGLVFDHTVAQHAVGEGRCCGEDDAAARGSGRTEGAAGRHKELHERRVAVGI